MANNHVALVADTLRARIPREVLLERLREAAIKAPGTLVDPGVPLLAQLLKSPKLLILTIPLATIIKMTMNNLLTVTSLPLLVVNPELIVRIRLLRDKHAGCPLRNVVDDPLPSLLEMAPIFQ